MKKITVAVAVVGLAAMVQADYFVNLSSEFGIYNAAGTAGILSQPNEQAIIQLIYDADANGAYETTAGQLNIGNLFGGDAQIGLNLTFINNNPANFTDFAAGNFGTIQATYLGAPVYARIFNDNDMSGTISVGDNYYIGAIQAAANKDFSGLPPVAELYNLGGGQDGQLASGLVVIPEPATFGLMGIAGLGMFLARKKARR